MAGIIASVREWADDFIGMIFPNVCEVCGQTLVHGEKHLCLQCLTAMPRVDLHRLTFSSIHQRLLGHAHIDRAASWFYYQRGNPYTRLIQVAKYNGRPSLARYLARMYATELLDDNFFDGIDVVVPVPMFKTKKFQRGYNQAEEIAREIAVTANIELCTDALICTRSHATQTRFGAVGRWLNARSIYAPGPGTKSIADRHVLIVDDVITTGATLHACCEVLHSLPEAPERISVLTLAMTALS